jgi:hypothetical protein
MKRALINTVRRRYVARRRMGLQRRKKTKQGSMES